MRVQWVTRRFCAVSTFVKTRKEKYIDP
jgi:hypothetical protein